MYRAWKTYKTLNQSLIFSGDIRTTISCLVFRFISTTKDWQSIHNAWSDCSKSFWFFKTSVLWQGKLVQERFGFKFGTRNLLYLNIYFIWSVLYYFIDHWDPFAILKHGKFIICVHIIGVTVNIQFWLKIYGPKSENIRSFVIKNTAPKFWK